MRAKGAPEDRGSSKVRSSGLAERRWLFMSVLLALVVLSFTCSAATERPTERQLLVAPITTQPDFSLPALVGSPQTLEQHAGRTVLVHFFATWCEPCREELTSLSGLADSLDGARFSILAVNVAEVPARVSRFLETSPVSFPILLDGDRKVTRAWGVNILPTTFVLDPALQVRFLVEGDVDWSRADIRSTLEQIDSDLSQSKAQQ